METDREIEAKEEKEDENEESGDDIPKRKSKSKVSNRQRWTEDEVKELSFYFNDFLKSRTSRSAFIDKVKQKIRKNNGVLHMRANHLIIKKISNMNHKLKLIHDDSSVQNTFASKGWWTHRDHKF